MLRFYHRLARFMHPYRAGLWFVLVGCAVAFIVGLFAMDGADGQPVLLVSVVLFVWGLSALSVVHGFAEPLPQAAADAGFFARLKVSATRAYLWLMAVVASVVSLGVVILTVRALGLAIRGG